MQNVGSGKYLNISEDAHDGTKAVGTDQPREWQVEPDEQDSSCYRYAVSCGYALRKTLAASDLHVTAFWTAMATGSSSRAQASTST